MFPTTYLYEQSENNAKIEEVIIYLFLCVTPLIRVIWVVILGVGSSWSILGFGSSWSILRVASSWSILGFGSLISVLFLVMV